MDGQIDKKRRQGKLARLVSSGNLKPESFRNYLSQYIEFLTYSPNFRAKVQEVRKRFNISIEGKEKTDNPKSIILINEYTHAVLEVLSLFGLAMYWKDCISGYIRTGYIGGYFIDSIHITEKMGITPMENRLFIEIFPYTRKDDITKHWDEILFHQKKMFGFAGKAQPWSKEIYKRNKLVMDSYGSGKKPRVIQKILEKHFHKIKSPSSEQDDLYSIGSIGIRQLIRDIKSRYKVWD